MKLQLVWNSIVIIQFPQFSINALLPFPSIFMLRHANGLLTLTDANATGITGGRLWVVKADAVSTRLFIYTSNHFLWKSFAWDHCIGTYHCKSLLKSWPSRWVVQNQVTFLLLLHSALFRAYSLSLKAAMWSFTHSFHILFRLLVFFWPIYTLLYFLTSLAGAHLPRSIWLWSFAVGCHSYHRSPLVILLNYGNFFLKPVEFTKKFGQIKKEPHYTICSG